MAQVAYLENEGIKIARGMVKNTIHVHKVGYNTSLQNGVEELFWSGPTSDAYWPTTANVVNVVSTSALDTSVVLTIGGLNENYEITTETITLNGTSASTTTNTFIRLNSAYVSGNVSAVGDISLRDDSNLISYIPSGYGGSLRGTYTIPAGYTGYLLKGSTATGKGGDAVVKMYVKPFGGSWFVSHIAQTYQGQYTYEFTVPIEIPEKSDLKVTGTSTSTGTTVSCAFDIILVKNPV